MSLLWKERSSLQNRASKFTPKKFYEIDPWFLSFLTKKLFGRNWRYCVLPVKIWIYTKKSFIRLTSLFSHQFQNILGGYWNPKVSNLPWAILNPFLRGFGEWIFGSCWLAEPESPQKKKKTYFCLKCSVVISSIELAFCSDKFLRKY
jgi:hypothetical protein